MYVYTYIYVYICIYKKGQGQFVIPTGKTTAIGRAAVREAGIPRHHGGLMKPLLDHHGTMVSTERHPQLGPHYTE